MELSAAGENRDFVASTRQASWQFAIMTVTGLLGAGGRPFLLLPVLAFAAITACLRLAPSRWWGPRSIVVLTLLLFVSLGLSTWSAGFFRPPALEGTPTGDPAMLTGPAYIVAFAWMGLHQSRRVILLTLPFAAITYYLALWLAGTPTELASSVLIAMPVVTLLGVATLVGVVLSNAIAQARLAKAEIKAEERWRAAIMATLAHDVRSPLTSIVGALEIVEDDPHTPTHHRVLLHNASRQAARILRLAAGLLEVERVDQGRLTLDRRNLPLAELLTDIATAHPALALQLDVQPDLSVWADRERLEQILVNLANNAARHGAPPLTISATSHTTGVDITVRDHGAGVPDQDVQHLFERFSSSDHAPQSVGLGLWIVRLLTEAHGGSVRYEPAAPGASFIVRLPHASSAKEPPIGQLEPLETTKSSKLATSLA